MQTLPHHYQISATGGESGALILKADGLPDLQAAPPAEFDGPGDQWSPETLLLSAAASCFILSFRAVATASKLDWVSLDCRVEGVLDRVERVTRFTKITTHADLVIRDATDREKAEQLLEKAESICLVANSLNAERSVSSSTSLE